MRLSFDNNAEIQQEVDQLLRDFPVIVHYGLSSIAPYPDFNSHNGFELFFVQSGSGYYIVADHIFPLSEGTFIFLRPYTLHKIIQNDPELNICRHVLIWPESFLPLPQPLAESAFAAECFRLQTFGEERRRLDNLLAQAHAEFTVRAEGHLDMLRSLLIQLLWTCRRLCGDAPPDAQTAPAPEAVPPGKRIPDEINYVVQYIGSHFMHEIPLEQLARLVHVNKFYLTALFRKHIGVTIGDFITKKRIHFAKKLLRETMDSLQEISFQCGFNNPSYFGYVFKAQEGMTPTEYRRHY